MKTVSIHFFEGGKELASATGRFPVLPGEAGLTWENKQALESRLKAPYKSPLPDSHFAESFERAFVTMAERCGLQARVDSTGEWESFVE